MTENKELLSLDKICKEDDYQEKEWWICKKCNKKIIEGDSHRKYCNLKKDKHKHKLLPDYTKQFVNNK